MTQYGTLITNIGLAQIANAQITQTKVGLEYIALGDGNGAHYVPTQNQTKLVHEVWRGPIAELSIDPTNSNRIIIDAVIPVTAGGFTIREIGIFDDKNNLIAVGQYPEKYKPQLSEGVSEETLIHFVIETNNTDVVKLTIDPTVIIASRNYVDGKVGQVQTAFTEHSTDNVRHVTAEEKSNWNAMLRAVTVGGSSEDANNPVASAILTSGIAKGAPDSGYWYIITFSYGGGGTSNIGQIAIAYLNNGSRGSDMRTRYRFGGEWSAWSSSFHLPTPVNAVLATGWFVNTGEALTYYKDGFGVVHVSGRVRRTDGNSSRRITTLPVGYRPTKAVQSQVTVGITGSGYVDIDINGNIDVWLEGSTNVSVLIDASFPTTV